MHSRASDPKRYCRSCGYDLHGLAEARCPECGRRVDPTNHRSFRATPLLPIWIRRARIIVVLLAVVPGLTYVMFKAARSYAYVRVIEVNTQDARVRDRLYHTVFGFTITQTMGAPIDTGLTAYLSRYPGPKPGDWVRAGSEVYDWRRRRVDSNLSHGIGQMLGGAPFKPENLPRVHGLVPDLPAMIRRDILSAQHHGVSAMLMINLRDMCADPTEENIKRLLEKWDWIKERPDLFSECGLRPAP